MLRERWPWAPERSSAELDCRPPVTNDFRAPALITVRSQRRPKSKARPAHSVTSNSFCLIQRYTYVRRTRILSRIMNMAAPRKGQFGAGFLGQSPRISTCWLFYSGPGQKNDRQLNLATQRRKAGVGSHYHAMNSHLARNDCDSIGWWCRQGGQAKMINAAEHATGLDR